MDLTEFLQKHDQCDLLRLIAEAVLQLMMESDVGGLMDASEHDVLACMAFPRQHRTRLHWTNPIEHLNKEVKRRADVVGNC